MLPGQKYLPEDIVRIAWHWKYVIVALFVVGLAGSLIYARSQPDLFRSDTLILVVPQRVPEAYVKSIVTARIEDQLPTIEEQIKTRTRLERIIGDFDLYRSARQSKPLETIVARMRNEITVQVVRGDAFRISYVSADRVKAMRVVNRLASEFVKESLADRISLAQNTTTFLATQLDDAKRQLQEREQRLAAFERDHAGELPSDRQSNLQAQADTEMQLQNLVESTNQDRSRQYLLERQIDDMQSERTADAGGEPADSTLAKLAAARAKLRTIEQQGAQPGHPDVKRLNQLIADLEAAARSEAARAPTSAASGGAAVGPDTDVLRANRTNEMRLQHETLTRQIEAKQADQVTLRQRIAMYQRRLEAIPKNESELTALTRDYETLKATYQSLLSKQEESKIAANLETKQIGEQFRTLDPARLPERPFTPNRPFIALVGAALGLGLGVGLVAYFEYTDKSLHTDRDVVRLLQLPVIATIPAVNDNWLSSVAWRVPALGSAVAAVNRSARTVRNLLALVLMP